MYIIRQYTLCETEKIICHFVCLHVNKWFFSIIYLHVDSLLRFWIYGKTLSLNGEETVGYLGQYFLK